MHGKVTTRVPLGSKCHGCHMFSDMTVGATWVASKPTGLNISE